MRKTTGVRQYLVFRKTQFRCGHGCVAHIFKLKQDCPRKQAPWEPYLFLDIRKQMSFDNLDSITASSSMS